jgi:hypothetical protein
MQTPKVTPVLTPATTAAGLRKLAALFDRAADLIEDDTSPDERRDDVHR